VLSSFDLIAVLLTLCAAFAFVNCRFFRLPNTIGVLLMGLFASHLIIGGHLFWPEARLTKALTDNIRHIDFTKAVMDGMLAFLLFASALHVDLGGLQRRAVTVGFMATMGVVISTALVGVGFWSLCRLAGAPVGFLWALVFGALISPTDAVAVLSTLKVTRVPPALETEMTGEALLNDGMGVVLFTLLVAAAEGERGHGTFDAMRVVQLIGVECFGAIALGLLTGYLAYLAMRAIEDYGTEVLISIALAMGTYSLAGQLQVSGPIAVVTAGLLIGHEGPRDAMGDEVQQYMFRFWTLVDEILNSVLFLLIGLEVLVLRFNDEFSPLAFAAVPIALVARFVSVAAPVLALRRHMPFPKGTIPVLTWGGIRGGISIALALALPEFPGKHILLGATYAVVLFSIVIQGLTLGPLVRRIVPVKPA
jgi:CPA1 family monovalent cation:H+ antiporter